ncbi:MAG: GMC family oxidoreductase [Deltaproteobacteria bacterium]|nr:GMC family oxidoreductase [Deltaproteobacteria bacterium]
MKRPLFSWTHAVLKSYAELHAEPHDLKETLHKAQEHIQNLPFKYYFLSQFFFFFIEFLIPLFYGEFGRFSKLPRGKTLKIIQALQRTKFLFLRLFFFLCKSPVLLSLKTLNSEYPSVIPAPDRSRGQAPAGIQKNKNSGSQTMLRISGMTKKDERKIYDFCVIGSGAGGAVAARALQENGFHVALLEKGGFAKKGHDELSSFTKYYRDQGLMGALGNTFIGVPTGEVVGGTTKINSGTCFETPQSVVEEWRHRLHLNISYEELLPHFEKLRDILSIQEVPYDKVSNANKLFAHGLEALGFNNHFPLNRNAKNCEGSGRCCFICPQDAKQSTDIAMIPKFLKQGGSLFTQTEVISIKEKKDHVLLVCKNHLGEKILFSCQKLIISGGALSSPTLIRKNKLGSEWKKAGNKLTVHPAAKVLAKFSSNVQGWHGVPQALGFKHPHFPSLSFEGVFTPPQLAAMVLPLEGEELNEWLNSYEKVASFGVMVKDSGQGKVRKYPWIGSFLSYHLHPDDFKALVEGARFMGLTYLAAGAEKILLPFNGIKNEFSSMDELKNYDFSLLKPRGLYSMGFHPLGTCGMGRVVDGELKLYGSHRIYVADGSVVPTSLGVNPQITIMSLALRLAQNLAASQPCF